MTGQFHASSHPGVLNKCKYEWDYTYIYRYIIYRYVWGANNCGQHSLKKKYIYFIMRFSPHFQFFYRLEFCDLC